MANYVKFNRGSKQAYNNLTTKDANALYFISNQGDKNGVLYMGEQIISALPDEKILTNNTNGELTLVDFGQSYTDNGGQTVTGFKAGLQPKVVLDDKGGYKISWFEPSSTTMEDVNSSLQTIATDITNIQNNISGLSTGIADNTAEIASIKNNITTLTETTIPNLIKTTIADETLLSYKIVSSIEEIESLELSNKERYIFLVPSTNSEDKDKYEEWMYLKTSVEGEDDVYVLEKVGDWAVDLSDYVTNTNFNTKIEELNGSIATLSADTADLQTIRNNITTLQNNTADLQTIRDNLSTLQNNTTDLQTIRDNISGLQTNVSTNTNTITSLQTTVAEVVAATTWSPLAEPTTV